MKQLLIGDMHVVPEELPECERVAALIIETVRAEQPDHVVFLGDQYNNHASVHVRVQEFWLRFFDRLKHAHIDASAPHIRVGREPKIIAIKGNHDVDPTHGVEAHALMAHRHQVIVVEEPHVSDGLLFVPYVHEAEEFYRIVESYPDAQVVLCHQSFNGAKYENGFYAEDGFDLEHVPQAGVISGHIHAPQNFSKVWYPGAPRWRSISDANTERGIYLVEHHEQPFDPARHASFVSQVKRFDTGPYCRKMFRYEVTPSSPGVPAVDPKDLAIVDIYGPADFCREQELKLKAAGARPRLHIENTAAISIRESEGIGKSFSKFLDAFAPKYGTDKAVLARLAQERLGL